MLTRIRARIRIRLCRLVAYASTASRIRACTRYCFVLVIGIVIVPVLVHVLVCLRIRICLRLLLRLRLL